MGDHAPRASVTATAEDAASETFPPRVIDIAEIEAGRRLFAGDAHFVAGANEAPALPPDGLPEIAFAGRSNVGKSSLVNALTGRQVLARTSKTPGRTRQINLFDLGGRLVLVDLPGYGYAEASKAAIADWTRLVQRYLRTRAALRRVCLLIDARHGIKENDRPLMQLLDRSGVSYQIVLTKIDKLARHDLMPIADRVSAELARHPAAHPEIHLTSAEKSLGIAALRAALASLARPSLAPREPAMVRPQQPG